MSWTHWQRRKLERPSIGEIFKSHLRESFDQIPREAGDIESEWTMFSTSIVDAVVQSCGCKVSGACRGSKPLLEPLTLTGAIVMRWKEYLKDLLNPNDTPSI